MFNLRKLADFDKKIFLGIQCINNDPVYKISPFPPHILMKIYPRQIGLFQLVT